MVPGFRKMAIACLAPPADIDHRGTNSDQLFIITPSDGSAVRGAAERGCAGCRLSPG